MTNALTPRQKRLRFSILGFGVLAGVLAVLSMGFYVVLTSPQPASLPAMTSFSASLAVSATLAVTLTSMLFWWLFIVRPNRLTLLRGVLAGIVSIICAIPLMWVFIVGYLVLTSGPQAFIGLAFVPGVTIVSFVLLFLPLFPDYWWGWWIGWAMLLIGGSAGGVFALLLRSIFHVTDKVEHSELALAVTPVVEQARETTPPTQAEQGAGVVPTVRSMQPPAPVTSQRPSFTADRLQETLQPAQRGISRRTVIVGLGLTGLAVTGGGITWWILAPHPHPLYTYRGHSLSVTTVAWSPDGKRIASAGYDTTVQVWDAADGGHVYTYRGHSSTVEAVAWSPDGKRIASGSDDSTVQVWDAADGSHVFTYRGHSPTAEAVAWSPDGTRIVSAGSDNVQMWDAANGGHVFTYQGDSSGPAVAWSPDGTRIASSGYYSTVQVWDASNGANVFTYRGHSDGVSSAAWSPDGKRIASGSFDKTVQVWDAADGSHVFTYRGHANVVDTVAWSPDGTRIASGSWDKTVQVWDAADGSHVFTYRGHSDLVHTVAWSPDGKRIASGSTDDTVQVWQAI